MTTQFAISTAKKTITVKLRITLVEVVVNTRLEAPGAPSVIGVLHDHDHDHDREHGTTFFRD